MNDFIQIILIAGGLAIFGVLVAGGVETWREGRRQERIRRVKRELAETQQDLQALTMQHQAWLNAEAHETRKALIMESFRAASQQARNGTRNKTRGQKHNNVSRPS
mgnify:CR=1 FL=1